MDRRARHLLAYLDRDIHLGADVSSGEEVYLPLEDMKKTSTHIVGAAGYGKSFCLRNLIRHFIRYRQPFALIDPHRELYEFALCALRRSSMSLNDVVLLDPGDQQYSLAFNPLCSGVDDPADASSLVLESVLKAWGAKSFDETPRLEGILRATFRLLAENQLSLLEAPDVLNVDNGELRRVLRDRLSDDWTREDLEELERWPRSEKLAMFESSRNRLRRFLQSATVQRMLGQRNAAINLRHSIDGGQILLANVGNTNSPETTRLLGALLLNGIYHAAKRRDSRRRRDFFVIVDECGQFATRDLANSLDELRKFGVHFILAHQRLSQLEREDADILSALMTNAKIKMVFGGLERREAERVGPELFTGSVRGDAVKHVTFATKFRPVDDVHEIETETWSDSEGEGEASGTSESRGTSGTWSDGDEPVRSEGDGTSSSRTSQRSQTRGGSRSIVPVTRHEEFQEETGRTYWSIDEQWEGVFARVHGLSPREAFVRVRNGPVFHITTAEVRDRLQRPEIERFVRKVLTGHPNVRSTAEALREIDERRQRLLGSVQESERRRRPADVKTFRS